MTAIERLLSELRDAHPDMTEVFQTGSCFNLFKILRVFFPEAQAHYSRIEGHVYVEIDGAFYDIRGKHLMLPPDLAPLDFRTGHRPHRWKNPSQRRAPMTELSNLKPGDVVVTDTRPGFEGTTHVVEARNGALWIGDYCPVEGSSLPHLRLKAGADGSGDVDTSLTQITLTDEVRALIDERDALSEYAFEATKAIVNLTPGGSEFFAGKLPDGRYKADLKRCTNYIQDRNERMHQMLVNARTQAETAKRDGFNDGIEAAAKIAEITHEAPPPGIQIAKEIRAHLKEAE